jgi:copper(I)-binding protein
MRPSRLLLALMAVAVGAAALIAACSGAPAKPVIGDAWARPGTAGAESAAYFAITAPSGQGDALLSASSPAANMVQPTRCPPTLRPLTGMHHIDRLDPAGETGA